MPSASLMSSAMPVDFNFILLMAEVITHAPRACLTLWETPVAQMQAALDHAPVRFRARPKPATCFARIEFLVLNFACHKSMSNMSNSGSVGFRPARWQRRKSPCPTSVQYTGVDAYLQACADMPILPVFIEGSINAGGRLKTDLCFFHGGNTGSIPVGRANDFNGLALLLTRSSLSSPTFLQ